MRSLALTLALLAVSAPAHAQSISADWQTFLDRTNASAAAGDADAMAALFAEDFVWTRDGQTYDIRGRAALRETFAQGLASGTIPTPFASESVDGTNAGAFAYVRGVYTYTETGRPVRMGFSSLMQRTPAGLVVQRLDEHTLATPAEAQTATADAGMRTFIDRINAVCASGETAPFALLFTDDGEYYRGGALLGRGQAGLRTFFRTALPGGCTATFAHQEASGVEAGAFVFVRGVYTAESPEGGLQSIAYAGLMRPTDAGFVAHRLVEF